MTHGGHTGAVRRVPVERRSVRVHRQDQVDDSSHPGSNRRAEWDRSYPAAVKVAWALGSASSPAPPAGPRRVHDNAAPTPQTQLLPQNGLSHRRAVMLPSRHR